MNLSALRTFLFNLHEYSPFQSSDVSKYPAFWILVGAGQNHGSARLAGRILTTHMHIIGLAKTRLGATRRQAWRVLRDGERPDPELTRAEIEALAAPTLSDRLTAIESRLTALESKS